MPIYPLTAGVSQLILSRAVRQGLDACRELLRDVLPDDVRRMALPVQAHRLLLKPEARMKGASAEQIVQELVSRLPVPVKRRV